MIQKKNIVFILVFLCAISTNFLLYENTHAGFEECKCTVTGKVTVPGQNFTCEDSVEIEVAKFTKDGKKITGNILYEAAKRILRCWPEFTKENQDDLYGKPSDEILNHNITDEESCSLVFADKYEQMNVANTDIELTAEYSAVCQMPKIEPIQGEISGEISEIEEILKKEKMKLQIGIPGLKFSDPETFIKLIHTDDEGNTFLVFPYLGEYIAAVYKYAVAVVGILAVVMIIVAGLQWTASGGNQEAIGSAKKRITQALIGFLLAVGSYTILYTINPALVEFKSLGVKFIQKIPFEVNYVEGPSTEDGYEADVDEKGLDFKGGTSNLPKSGKVGCLMETYTPGLQVGDKLGEDDKIKVDLFNLGLRAIVNKRTEEAFNKVSTEVLNSSDPELRGYLEWMKDFKDKKAPDLHGKFDGKGTLSTNLRPIGWKSDTHAMGLAVDIMTRSNWDIHIPAYTGKKGVEAEKYCRTYEKNLKKMKSGDFNDKSAKDLTTDPYKMYDRIEKKLKACFNNFNDGTEPFTTIPDEMVKIFERNGFYWAGWGWTKPGKPIVRSDSMHFEYRGECQKK